MSIIEIARKDLGKKEKPGNTGFYDADLEKWHRAVGWSPGWAWCSTMVEVWAWEAYPEKKAELQPLFVPSAVNTFRNLVRAGYKVSETPIEGAFVFWQKIKDGAPQWMGHAGLCVQVIDDKTFKSIEGNTSNSGSRNGDGVYELTRTVNPEVKNGLRVLGFIKI